jgi:hypothetical protein
MAIFLQPNWNESEHQRLLKRGWLVKHFIEIDEGQIGIYIARRVSYEPGFGTASMRAIMQEYFSENCKGGIYNLASSTSHLFHLYMGMIPIDMQIGVVPARFGWIGEDVMRDLPSLQDRLKKGEECEEFTVKILKGIIYYARTNKVDRAQAEQITTEDILGCQDELTELNKKTVSYISGSFIPLILRFLESCPGERQPRTDGLSCVNMKMSDAGMARWKAAIENKQPFVPFKRLEHLHAYMDDEQLQRLNQIMNLRERALNQKQMLVA